MTIKCHDVEKMFCQSLMNKMPAHSRVMSWKQFHILNFLFNGTPFV